MTLLCMKCSVEFDTDVTEIIHDANIWYCPVCKEWQVMPSSQLMVSNTATLVLELFNAGTITADVKDQLLDSLNV